MKIRKKAAKRLLILLGVASIIIKAYAWDTGAPYGVTNAPGESNCTSCHSGTLVNNSTIISLTLDTIGAARFQYRDDSTYTLVVSAAESGISKWGFEITALRDADSSAAGSFSGGAGLFIGTSSVSGKTRDYVTHSNSTTSGSGGRSWTFKWTAPHAYTGNVSFYICVNATNGDGTSSGDQVNFKKFTISLKHPKTPETGFIVSSKKLCTGDSISFKDTSTNSPTSWAWTFKGGTPSTSTLQNPKVVFGAGSSLVSLTAKNSFGTGSTFSETIHILPKPLDTLYQLGKSLFCQGDSVGLFADYNGYSFQWSSGQTSQGIFATKSGRYYCTVSDSGCNAITQSVTVTMIPKPDIKLIMTSGSKSICQGDSFEFSLKTDGKSVAWFNNDTLLPGKTSNSLTLKNLIGKDTIYAIAYDSVGCPSDTSTKYTVTVVPTPVITLQRTMGGDAICQGDTVKWTVKSSVKTYKFYNKGLALPTTASSTYVLSNLSDSNNLIYAVAYNSLGCPSDTTAKFIENVSKKIAAPGITAGKTTVQSVSFSWSPVANAAGYEVSKDSGKTWQTVTGTMSYTDSGLASNLYVKLFVRATNVSACGHAPATSILLSTLPCSQTTYGLHADSIICPNTVAQVVFSRISAPHYAITVNGKMTKDTSFIFSPHADTTINFAMLDSLKASCGAFNISIPLKVTQVPTLAIAANRASYCEGDRAVITANPDFDEYKVFGNGKSLYSGNASIFNDSSYTNGDKIIFKAIVSGCPSNTSNTITLVKYPLPRGGFIYNRGSGEEVAFRDTTPGDISRTWYFGDGANDTMQNPVHQYSSYQHYTVSLVAVGQGGCMDSVSEDLRVSGISQASGHAVSFSIAPNPFRMSATVSYSLSTASPVWLSIYDLSGRQIGTIEDAVQEPGDYQVHISSEKYHLTPGVYILKFAVNGNMENKKMILY